MRTVIHDPNELVVLRNYQYDYEAELARAVLHSSGIATLMIRESCVGLGTGPVQLAVRRADVTAAIETLEPPADLRDADAESTHAPPMMP